MGFESVPLVMVPHLFREYSVTTPQTAADLSNAYVAS
jgi:hypothetical protein